MFNTQLIEKLKSKNGSSIIMALVVILVVVTLSALILGSAYLNAGKIKQSQQNQQKYLAVSSAAKMLKSAFAGDVVEDKNGTWLYNELAAGEENPLSGEVKNLLNGLSTEEALTITTDMEGFPAVNGIMQKYNDNGIVISLYILEGSVEVHPMTIVMNTTAISPSEFTFNADSMTVIKGAE